MTTTAAPSTWHLTPAEHAVLLLLAEGLSNQQIAERRLCSVGTVSKHVQAVYGKLGARNRAHAAVLAMQAGLVR
jgi:DNA-binding NarL/FixJ family response regulator